MEALGQELRKEREKRNISLKELADVTRISRRYLEALEDDKLDVLPGGFFIKGIVRSYAKALGIDEELWVERYRRAGASGSAAPPSDETVNLPARISKKTKLSLTGAAAVVLAAATFGLYYLTRAPKTPQVPESRPVYVPAEAQTRTDPPPEAPVEAAPVRIEEETGLRLQITFTAETWTHIQDVMDRQYPDLRILGWYHTHPGHGIFLSDMDLFIHKNFFNLPWQVAMVVDPCRETLGFLRWRNGRMETTGFYYLEDEGAGA